MSNLFPYWYGFAYFISITKQTGNRSHLLILAQLLSYLAFLGPLVEDMLFLSIPQDIGSRIVRTWRASGDV